MDYHQKYLKYKAKYLELQKQLEGSGIKTQLNELQTHFGQLKQKRDEGFERQRQKEERKKKEEEFEKWFMKIEVEDLKKWVKTLTDEQIINLPYKNDYMPPYPRSLTDEWFYLQSYQHFDDELKKIKKEAEERVEQKESDRHIEELLKKGIDPYQ